MKSILLASALVALSSSTVLAQKQWVSLGLNGLGGTKSESSQSNDSSVAKNTGTFVYPVIGYHRFIGKDWGLGLELGYRKISYTSNQSYQGSSGENYMGDMHNRETTYRVAPSVFQNYSWKKYRGVASLAIPIEIRTDVVQEHSNTNASNPPGPGNTYNYEIHTYPNELCIGINPNLAIQRQIIGGLYFGPQLGFGVERASSNGTVSTSTTYGPLNGTRQTTVVNTEGKNVRYSFIFTPSLSLNYYF